jgi:hypothetical protein
MRVPAFVPVSSQPADDGPVLPPVDDEVVAVADRGQADAGRSGQRDVEVRGAARVARRLARRPPAEVGAGRVGGGRPQDAFLLLVAAVPGDRHQPEAVAEHGAGEAGVDRADLLGGDDQVDAGDPAAAVLGGQHAHGDARLVRLDVGTLGHPEALERVGLGVRRRDHRLEDVLGERTDVVLQLALLVGQREVDRHGASLRIGIGDGTGRNRYRAYRFGTDPVAADDRTAARPTEVLWHER